MTDTVKQLLSRAAATLEVATGQLESAGDLTGDADIEIECDHLVTAICDLLDDVEALMGRVE